MDMIQGTFIKAEGVVSVSDKIYTLDEIRSIAVPVAKQYGVDALYLFGSYARGEATPQSDLDFRIERGRICSLIQLSAMYSELAGKFQKNLDLLTSQNIDPEFLAAIRPEEVLLYAQH